MKWLLPEQEQANLIAFRRELHQYPELSWQEVETSRRVVRELRQLGLEPQTGVAKTGLVVDIGEDGPTVMLRADMDALPIQEATGLEFASKNPGVMHACGHDAHTSCLVAVARRLVADPPKQGRVRLIFQPAEEGAGGADGMIRQGILENPRPTAIYGLHFWSQMPVGEVGVCAGPMMGSVDHLHMTVKGRGGHGAAPHTTADPIVAAAHLVTSLQTIVSRRLNPLSPVVVSIGKFEAGTAFNVIPEEAKLVGTIRTMEPDSWGKIPALLEEVIPNTVAAFGCTAEFSLMRQLRPLVNHAPNVAMFQEIAKPWVGEDNVKHFQTLGGEDFGAFLEQVPGCFFFVGAKPQKIPEGELAAPHHSAFFELDEDGFALGVRLLEECARTELQRQCRSHNL